jgi:hypothetical protein
MPFFETDPTIKWFEANNATPKDYSGGRDATSLEKFAEGLAPKCLIDDTSECTDKEKKYIVKMQAEDAKKVAKQLKRLEGMKGGRMKAELKQWVAERINILKVSIADSYSHRSCMQELLLFYGWVI